MSDVSRLLEAVRRGDPAAANALLPIVYDELCKLAGHRLAQERGGQTLQATALVHEAYVRLVSPEPQQAWSGRGHFFAAAAEAMRRILIENALRKKRLKRGGDWDREELHDVAAPEDDDRLLALDEALTELAKEDPLAAKVVELRHFAGLCHEGIAEALDVSVYEARQKWTYDRAWLAD